MRRAITAGVLFLPLLLGCRGDEPKRQVFHELQLSALALSDWQEERRSGFVFLVDDSSEASIGLRAETLQHLPDTPGTSFEDMVGTATRSLLERLPDASVDAAAVKIDHARYPSLAFNLSFQPASKPDRYERRHVVLFGSDQRVIHLIHSAPSDQLDATAELFTEFVESVEEVQQ